MPNPPPVVKPKIVKLLHEFPHAPSKQLARTLLKRWPGICPSLEAARTAVRRTRNAQGARNRRHMHDAIERPKEEAEACRKSGIGIPLPEPNPWRWHELPKGPKLWLIIADLHVPYHDKTAIEIALRFARKRKTDGLLILGDLADNYQISPWVRDPSARRFVDEVEIAKTMLDAMQSYLKPKATVWKFSNHEARLERYLWRRAPELYGFQEFSFEHIMHLAERNITVIPPNDPIRVGRLTLLHGHEWPSGTTTPVNPARTAFLKALACCLVAHQHRTSYHPETTIEETTISCWSIGCLCDCHPQYRPFNNWNHGCALLDLTGEMWRVENHPIVNGEVV